MCVGAEVRKEEGRNSERMWFYSSAKEEYIIRQKNDIDNFLINILRCMPIITNKMDILRLMHNLFAINMDS